MIKCCEIDFFLWHMWHARQVPSYKRTPQTRERDTFHSNTAPLAPFAEWKSVSVFAIFWILLEEGFLRTNLSWKPFGPKTHQSWVKKNRWNWNPYMCQVLWVPVYLLAGPVIYPRAPTAKTTRWLCERKMQT